MEGLKSTIDRFLEDYDFEASLKEKRHKELRKDLSELLKAVNQPVVLPDQEPIDLSAIEEKIDKLRESTDQMPKSIEMLTKVLKDTLENKRLEPVRDWTFTIDRQGGDPKGPIVGGRFIETSSID